MPTGMVGMRVLSSGAGAGAAKTLVVAMRTENSIEFCILAGVSVGIFGGGGGCICIEC